MRTSPFLTPDPGRRGARRRRVSRTAGAAVLALVIAAAAAAAILIPRSHAGSRRAAARAPGATARAHRPAPPAPAQPALAPTGLPLGTPSFKLTDIGTGVQDPVRIAFHAPPRAGLLFDLDDGRVLWQRNALERLRIASLTKMMTALLAVKSGRPDGRVLVTREAIDTDGSKVGVLPLGRRVPFETMLYGLLLPSGNDAAVALAQHLAGSVGRFVQRMNDAAAKLGLGCSRFASPSGYIDQDNFSCAADLAELAHLDLAQPRIARITRTASAILPFPIKGGKLYLYNNNPMLRYGYPGTTGLKTGYTVASGRCLVATAQRRGVRLGVVLLDSPDPATQARKLLDRAFERIYHQRPVPEPPMPAGA
ncbi:MAG TPA: D-alanyl-D-alanine carboxypeptidase family protein [Solirubrobacteraceae bacterium]|jgi:D-alanyl-D-alanine carboxypeptidase (penicillin-binding protein 5/6)|nr:D-alanyl-D-alanine carboxypeptidase family protein [Solirubrobacteraceae bacterium]